MHPHLWTIPGINYRVEWYGFTIAVGIVLAIWISVRRAKKVGADPSAITSMSIVGVFFGIVGCRVMHYAHHWGKQLRSGELGVADVVTATSGGEIVGGIVLAVVSVMVYLAWRRKPIGVYLDIVFPPMILAMGIGRVGCLFAGCCWGGMCQTAEGARALPWAVHFPYNSPAHVRAWEHQDAKIPSELLWQPPLASEPFPIPRLALERTTIDGNPALEEYAVIAREIQLAKAEAIKDQDGGAGEFNAEQFKPQIARLKELTAQLGYKPGHDEAYAALHLRALRQAGMPRTWAELRTLSQSLHSPWVHPTQLYDAISLTLIYFVLSAIFWRRKRAGMVVAWGMMLYGVNRFLQEMVRGDNPHDTLGLTISQFMSLLILGGGLVLALSLLRRPAIKAIEPAQQPA